MSGKMKMQRCAVSVENKQVENGMATQMAVFTWDEGVFIAPVVTSAPAAHAVQEILEKWVTAEAFTFEKMCAFTHTQLPNGDTRVVLRLDGGLLLEPVLTNRRQFRIMWEVAEKVA